MTLRKREILLPVAIMLAALSFMAHLASHPTHADGGEGWSIWTVSPDNTAFEGRTRVDSSSNGHYHMSLQIKNFGTEKYVDFGWRNAIFESQATESYHYNADFAQNAIVTQQADFNTKNVTWWVASH